MNFRKLRADEIDVRMLKMYKKIKQIQKDNRLTKQQRKTIVGQMRSGDIQGGLKGYENLLRRGNKWNLED